MWQTLAKIAIPIVLDKGIDYLTKNSNSQSNTVSINPDYKTGSSQYMNSLSPEQRQNLQRAINDSGLNNQKIADQSPGWEYRTGGAWQSPNGNAGGAYNQAQSGYSTISNPNLLINNQKSGVYNDLLKPVVKETGNQLAKEAVGYFTSGETGPLLDLLGEGATYLSALL